jgi:hypothetical protein
VGPFKKLEKLHAIHSVVWNGQDRPPVVDGDLRLEGEVGQPAGFLLVAGGIQPVAPALPLHSHQSVTHSNFGVNQPTI